jgi:hypothetical protein
VDAGVGWESHLHGTSKTYSLTLFSHIPQHIFTLKTICGYNQAQQTVDQASTMVD